MAATKRRARERSVNKGKWKETEEGVGEGERKKGRPDGGASLQWSCGRRGCWWQYLQRVGVGEEGSGRLEGKQGRVIRFLFFLIRLE